MQFQIVATDGAARRGKLALPHGSVDTPAFMPIGTYGAVKTLSPRDLREIGTQIVLGNTFHLWLRPGVEVIEAHAGLHFDAALLQGLRDRGVSIAFLTLHVGAGTFQPVRAQDLAQHEMHGEWYDVPQATVDAIIRARGSGGRVLAAGTTTLRALESAAAGGELKGGRGETRLFILPGYRFRVVERLLTNFHLPRSTLLMLVSAFGGMDNIRRAYRHAIESRYRFYSYGDAMLIERAGQ